MGIGDSIGKAAENAMEDLAGTSSPTENPKVPEPTDPNSDVEVHSSISEGSNAMEAEKEKAPGLKPGTATGPVSANPAQPGDGALQGGERTPTTDSHSHGTGAGSNAAGADTPDVPRGVPGPGGLPESDPDSLRADPGEADEDPSSNPGRS